MVPINGPNGALTVSAHDFLASANSTPTGDSERPFYDRKFEYSNIGYALVALAIERISGMRYADFLRQRLLEPLGMNSTVIYESQLAHSENIALGIHILGRRFLGSPATRMDIRTSNSHASDV